MSGAFGTRGARSAADPGALYRLRRDEREAVRRRTQVPEILRGTLLDPNGERNLADEVRLEAARRAAAARRLSPVGWLVSCAAAAALAPPAAYGILYAARMGVLPDLGLIAIPGLAEQNIAYGGIGRATFYGLVLVIAVMQLFLGRHFARRMYAAGRGAATGFGLYLAAWLAAATAYQASGPESGAVVLAVTGFGLFVYGLIPGADH